MRQPLVGHASTYLVELVAQINRVDVIALQIREHDDLSTGSSSVILIALVRNIQEYTHKEDHREEKSRRHEDGEEEEPCCVHKRPLMSSIDSVEWSGQEKTRKMN
jgi:hypothetical protein